MATYITVEQQQAAQLLEANRKQTEANRLGLDAREKATRERIAAENARIAKLALQGKGADGKPLNSSRRQLRPLDEVAAFRRGGQDGVLLAFIYVDYLSKTYWIEPTNRSNKVEIFGESVAPVEYNVSLFYVLPAGGGNTIIVVASDNSFSLPANELANVGRIWNAAIVSATGVRLINVPAAFKQAALASVPPGNSGDSGIFPTVGTSRNAIVSNFAFDPDVLDAFSEGVDPLPIYDIPGQQGEEQGFNSGYWMSGTPGIYSLLSIPNTQLIDFQDSTSWAKSQILSAAPTPSYGLSTCGGYSGRSCGGTGTYSFYKLPTLPTGSRFYTSTALVQAPIAPIRFNLTSPPRPVLTLRAGTPSIPFWAGEQIPPSYIMSWDWGKPDYCRQQLLALGFSAADLTP